MAKETYWKDGRIPTHDAGSVLGTHCTGCGVVLTLENLGAHTDKVGACSSCRPRGNPPEGMVNTAA